MRSSFFPYNPHDGQRILLPPFVVVTFRPAVHPDYVLVVLVVNVVGEAHYDLGVEIVPAVEKLSLHMLEAGQ